MKVCFESEDLGIEFRDSGRWRSYEMSASGNTLQELIKDATISEVDQDGGTINCYGIDDAPNSEIFDAAMKLVTSRFAQESKPLRVEVCGEDLGVEFRKRSPWRSFHLNATGTTFEELVKDACVTEVASDGEDLTNYPLIEAGTEVMSRGLHLLATEYIDKLMLKHGVTRPEPVELYKESALFV